MGPLVYASGPFSKTKLMTDIQNLIITVARIMERLYETNEIQDGKVTAQTAMRILGCGKNKLAELTTLYPIKDPEAKGHHRYFVEELFKIIG